MFNFNTNLTDEYRFTRLACTFLVLVVFIIVSSIVTYNKFYFIHVEKMSEQGYEQVKDERTSVGTLWVKKGGTHESPN